jgi:hypothetical protein
MLAVNTTSNEKSVISWSLVVFVEETGLTWESHQPFSMTSYRRFSHYYGVLTPLNQWWKNL